jgi:hypothetical protein
MAVVGPTMGTRDDRNIIEARVVNVGENDQGKPAVAV